MTLRLAPKDIVTQSTSPLLATADWWERCPLGDIAQVTNGAAFKSAKFNNNEDGLPLVRIRDVGQPRASTHYSGDYEDRHLVESGNLLIGMDGDFRIARWTGGRALLNQRVCRVQVHDPDLYCDRFLEYVLQPYLDEIHKVTSSVTVKHLSSRTLTDLPIPLPPRAEQERVVGAIEEYFSRLDAASDAITTAQTRIEVSRRSVLTEAFAGQLAPQDPSDETASALLERIAADRGTEPAARVGHSGPTDLPLGWTWARLDDLATAEPRAITDGPFGSNLKTAHYTESGPRVIRLQNIGDGVFKHEDAHVSEEHYLSLVRHAVQEGDLVVASLGETLPRACLVPGWVPPAIVKADCIRVRLHPEVNSSYVNFALQHPGLRRQTATEIKGVGRPRLGLKGIRNLAVPLAPPAEQQRVVTAIEEHYARLDATSQATVATQTKIEALRRCVLSEAVTGRLVPQDPDDEPAAVLLDRIAASRPLNANRRRVTA